MKFLDRDGLLVVLDKVKTFVNANVSNLKDYIKETVTTQLKEIKETIKELTTRVDNNKTQISNNGNRIDFLYGLHGYGGYTFTTSGSPSQAERGSKVNVTITWSCVRKDPTGNVAVDLTKVSINSTEVSQEELKAKKKIYNNVAANTTYNIIGEISDKKFNKSHTINFYNKKYYGFENTKDITGMSGTDVKAGTDDGLCTSKGHKFSSHTYTKQRPWVAYPKVLGLITSIKDGNNQSYTAAEIDSPGATKATFLYKTISSDDMGKDEDYVIYMSNEALNNPNPIIFTLS